MTTPSPKLPLTDAERAQLRLCHIRLRDIAGMDVMGLSDVLECLPERAKSLRALAEFQTIPSIGPKAAQWVVDLGYFSLDEIRHETGANLLNRLEQRYGYWLDPCVEDTLRCIVHHANTPGSDKSWFAFTEDRKTYRQQHGYPATRPTLAWHEVNS